MGHTMLMKISVQSALAATLLTGILGLAPCAAAQATNSAAPPAPAQPPASSAHSSPAPAARPRSVYHKSSIDDRVKGLTKALDLNETQQAGLKAVLEHQQMQARKIQFDQTIEGGERIARIRALQEDTVLRIRALLNDEQKMKYDPLNHAQPSANPSDSYIDQWMRHHQQPAEQPAPAPKN